MPTVIHRSTTEPDILDPWLDAAPATLTTTLYDLVATIQTDVDPSDDALVVATVFHVLHSGRATWCREVVAGTRYEILLMER